MSRTVSVEQLDGKIAELEQEREKLELKIGAVQSMRVMFFGTDASGGGQTSEPEKPPVVRRGRRRGEDEKRPLNTCAECQKTWPRSKTIQKRACPHCGSDSWQG